jgi:hypothetical protein
MSTVCSACGRQFTHMLESCGPLAAVLVVFHELRSYLSSLFEAILLASGPIKPGFRQLVAEEAR